MGAALRRVLRAEAPRRRAAAARARPPARGGTARRPPFVELRDRPRRARLHFQNRRLRAALRPRHSRRLEARRSNPAPSRFLAARALGESDGTRLHRRPDEKPGRVRTARRDHAPPVRALLLREQIRGRSRSLRGAGKRAHALPHRPEPDQRPRLLDGRREHVASRHALRGDVGGGRAGRGLCGDGGIQPRLRRRQDAAAVVGAGALPLVRRHALRRKPRQHHDRGLLRRDRRPEAGRRHHAPLRGKRGPHLPAHHRPADRAQIPPGGEAEDRGDRDGGGGERAGGDAEEGSLHDLLADLSANGMALRYSARERVGASRHQCRACREWLYAKGGNEERGGLWCRKFLRRHRDNRRSDIEDTGAKGRPPVSQDQR